MNSTNLRTEGLSGASLRTTFDPGDTEFSKQEGLSIVLLSDELQKLVISLFGAEDVLGGVSFHKSFVLWFKKSIYNQPLS